MSISIVGELAKNYKGRPPSNGMRSCCDKARASPMLRGRKGQRVSR
jgi:hypothetical protein